MDFSYVYTKSAEKDLKRLDQKVAIRILKKLEEFRTHTNPLSYAKLLKGFKIETYRFRVGDYRIIFRLDPKTSQLIILVVLRIVHRREAYQNHGQNHGS